MNQASTYSDPQRRDMKTNKGDKWILSAVAIFSIFLVASCNQKSTTSTNGTTASKQDQLAKRSRCEDRITSAFTALQPENLEISSSPGDVAQQLNTWYTYCADLLQELETKSTVTKSTETESTADQTPEFQHEIDQLIPQPYQAERNRDIFDVRDVGHIRDCVLLQGIVDQQEQSGSSDMERVKNLFDYVQRNYPIEAYTNQRPPLSRYRILLYGTTYPEDRAWIFASLLRQIKIDSVIIRPQSEANEQPKPDAWIMGVLLDEDVYLFDCRLGMPLTSAGRVATLGEAIAKPALFRRWDIDIDNPYPLRSSDLKKVHADLIGTMCTFSKRMADLQSSLSGDQSVIISDSLLDNYLGPGLVHRVAKGGEAYWKPEDIRIWNYPEENENGYDKMDKNLTKSSRWFQLRQLALSAPVQFTPPLKPGQRFQYFEPLKEQWPNRITHLMGKHSKAIPMYQTIREWGKNAETVARMGIDPTIFNINYKAGQDAFFWTALCQIERGDKTNAVKSLAQYARNHGKNGFWIHATHLKIAELNHQNGDIDKALRSLSRVSDSAPQYHRAIILKRRWEAEQQKSKVPEKDDNKTDKADKNAADNAKAEKSESDSAPSTKIDTEESNPPQ